VNIAKLPDLVGKERPNDNIQAVGNLSDERHEAEDTKPSAPKADIRQRIEHVRFVPVAEILSPNRASDSSGDISDVIAGLVSVGSDNSAICTEYLAVDPGAVGAGEEGNGIGNIFRLSETLERREFGELIDDFLGLSVEEWSRRRRAWRHCVDGDVSAQLLRENACHRLNASLGGSIDGVGRMI
jgi:hypothetical protein